MMNDELTTYKNTKIGVIPMDWEVKQFDDIATFFSGGTPLTSNEGYYNGKIPFIKSGEIYDVKTEQFISGEGFANSSAKMVEKGDILYALYGANSGEVAISKINGAINQAILCVKLKENNSTFIHSYLLKGKNKIVAQFLQGGQGNLSAKIIKSLLIPVPPLPEQKAIADCLTTWDKGIEKLTALITAKKQQKKGLMQSIFNDKLRIKNWKEVKLGEVCERVTTRNVELNDNVVTISAKRGFVIQEEYFNKRVASKTLSNYYLIQKNDFAYNKSYSNGYPMGAIKQLTTLDRAVVTTLYICFRANSNIDKIFLKYYFDSGKLNKGLSQVTKEGGRAHGLLNISIEDFFGLKLKVPLLSEQQEIANVLSTADKEITLLEQKLVALQTQKRGLMQVLLNGKLRMTNQ